MMTPIDVFILYAPEDATLLRRLEKHLATLKRQGLLRAWSDLSVRPGERREETLAQYLTAARVILLLVSVDFLDSYDGKDGDMAHVLERERRGEAYVIPILLRPCDWRHASFAHLQVLPKNHEPLVRWGDSEAALDAAFLEVVSGIREVIKELTRDFDEVRGPPQPNVPVTPSSSPSEEPAPKSIIKPVDSAEFRAFESLPQVELVYVPWPELTGPIGFNSLPTTRLRLFPWNDEAL